MFGLRLSGSALCLHAGEQTSLPTPAPHEIAYRVTMADDCGFDEWQLAQDPVWDGSFIVKSREIADRNLDIQFGSAVDETPVILYPLVTGSYVLHQRFYFDERAPGIYQILPGHASGMCLTRIEAGDNELEIAPCSETESNQSWELLPRECAPD